MNKTLFVIVALLCLASASPVTASDLKLVSSDVGLTHACSYYQLTDSTVNALTWINDVKTLNISKITETHGNLKNLAISWGINQTTTNLQDNISYVCNPHDLGNGTIDQNCSAVNKPYNLTTWSIVYEPIWSSTVSKSALTSPTITSNLSAHSTSAYLQ